RSFFANPAYQHPHFYPFHLHYHYRIVMSIAFFTELSEEPDSAWQLQHTITFEPRIKRSGEILVSTLL
ncbi:MAG: hypothetical protein LBK41_00365, partial [Clostridiales bacterium]|nr:hypothetical protein [Clostridiales bacterium]